MESIAFLRTNALLATGGFVAGAPFVATGVFDGGADEVVFGGVVVGFAVVFVCACTRGPPGAARATPAQFSQPGRVAQHSAGVWVRRKGE